MGFRHLLASILANLYFITSLTLSFSSDVFNSLGIEFEIFFTVLFAKSTSCLLLFKAKPKYTATHPAIIVVITNITTNTLLRFSI